LRACRCHKLTENGSTLVQGAQMADHLEFNSRATLCRELAQREPENRVYWIAEAESWSLLSKESPSGKDNSRTDSGVLARLRVSSTRRLA